MSKSEPVYGDPRTEFASASSRQNSQCGLFPDTNECPISGQRGCVMELLVNRTTRTDNSTEGTLSVNGQFQCYTLEPTYREISFTPVERWKIPGKTAIAVGGYPLAVSYFERGGYYTPILLNVPGFLGVRIHIGNYPQATEGCILVGTQANINDVACSKIAFDALMKKIHDAQMAGLAMHITVQ